MNQEPMIALLLARSRKAKPVELGQAGSGGVRKANGDSPHSGRSEIRWFNATVQNAGSERDDFELIHWKKVWRSMAED